MKHEKFIFQYYLIIHRSIVMLGSRRYLCNLISKKVQIRQSILQAILEWEAVRT